MEQYLIDTNILSYYLSGRLDDSGIEQIESLITAKPNISIITKIELLCWKTSVENDLNIRSLIDESNVINITDDIVSTCVTIRKEKRIKLPDAIIAATAISLGLILITANKADFYNIPTLRIINAVSVG